MENYFFSDEETFDDILPDDVGIEFETLEAASAMAERSLREIAADAPLEQRTHWMTVRDHSHVVVYRARLDIVICQI